MSLNLGQNEKDGPLSNRIEGLGKELAEMRQQAQQFADSLTAEQLVQRPDPANWSIAHCFAHLNLTATLLQLRMDAAIHSAKEQRLTGSGPFRLGTLGRILIYVATPPPKFRMKAPRVIAPSLQIDDPKGVLADFMRCQDEWERLAKEAEGLNQSKAKVPIAMGGLLTLRLNACFPWMMAHQRRHLWQAENVRRKIEEKHSQVTSAQQS